jgi:predicted TIM-barrel fold metal-dependent hydrolase
MKLDAFCHILPQPYFERLMAAAPNGTARNLQKRVSAIPSLHDLDVRFRQMDEFEDYAQIISLASPPIEQLGNGSLPADLARLANDELAELCRTHPDRFPGFVAGMPLNDPEAATAELERAVKELGALGGQIFTNVNGAPLDDPRLEPLWAKAAELDKTLWMHPSRNADWPDYPGEERSKYEIWWTFGWPYETSVAMARLVFSGVLDRHPGLRILTHHGGAMVPFFSGRVGPGWDQLGTRTPEAERADVSTPLTGRPLDAFKRFYADTAVFGAPHALRCAVDFWGVDHVLFASDTPFDPERGTMFIRETIADVDGLDLSETERAAIYEGNARKVLGVPSSDR